MLSRCVWSIPAWEDSKKPLAGSGAAVTSVRVGSAWPRAEWCSAPCWAGLKGSCKTPSDVKHQIPDCFWSLNTRKHFFFPNEEWQQGASDLLVALWHLLCQCRAPGVHPSIPAHGLGQSDLCPSGGDTKVPQELLLSALLTQGNVCQPCWYLEPRLSKVA